MSKLIRHMDLKPWNHRARLLELTILWYCFMDLDAIEEARQCKEHEYRTARNCLPCIQCDPGQELSTECGFGFGEGARCVPCRPGRFKDNSGVQKCKPCLACGRASRLQTSNCSATINAVCGDCLSGFYRRTRLSGFEDMECIPCGDPPPANEPQCTSRMNLVPLSSVVSSPHDNALAAVICSALASVLLALLLLCAIYCKRHLERKPHEPCQEGHCDAEFSCLEHIQVQHLPDSYQQNICNCYHVWGHTSRVLHCLCCDEPCSVGHINSYCLCCSQISHDDSLSNPGSETFSGCQRFPGKEVQMELLETSLLCKGNHHSQEEPEDVPTEELRD
ncbi:tumor necrosis factor receptor superfamily member 19-like isoform X1 [Hypomesus transpacificus]|uniref:tumor necrosis factor receptor superfamily member 19-like isoform X1 n=2 Tax=Hypomesus transpacificus TaxID=137520 RepID=UPI001F080F5F|nr:tumor necrosis factor receptor superfamily member 19-like isoform X1 [Hypomesus transpacificus]